MPRIFGAFFLAKRIRIFSISSNVAFVIVKKQNYICSTKNCNTMPAKLVPTSKQKSTFMLHTIVFVIANIALWAYWYYVQGANHQWVYPWGSWVTAAWALSLIGHAAAVYMSSEDKGNDDYLKQLQN
jgi:hypothetical protein